MKLDRLSVQYNIYAFEHEGIPAQSYGGKVVFRDDQANITQINLSPSAIDQIMQVVSIEVANNAKRMLASMTVESVRDSARPLCIVHDGHEAEEADFHESF